jgi:hypothetical protein
MGLWRMVAFRLVAAGYPKAKAAERAAAWKAEGFDPWTAARWIDHGVWDPEEAVRLEDLDADPEDADYRGEWW